ncbi:MAG: hemolysin XhlA family protein [Pikeienuella sp.]
MTDDEWRASAGAKLSEIERRLTQVETKNAVDEVHRTNVESRLGSIEDTLKWLVRLVIGGLVMAAMAFALKGGFTLG